MDHEDMIKVDASVRERCGTGSARALRARGLIPAVIYGKNRDPINISLSQVDFLKKCRTFPIFSKLIELCIGEKKEYVITKDIQKHPVSGAIAHVDFQFVDQDAEMKMEVPLVFLNEQKCVGVKRGGVINILHRSLIIRCSPHHIPKSLEVDLIDVAIGHSLHVSDLKLPSTINVVMKEEDPVIATVVASGGGISEDAEEAAPASDIPEAGK
ncbi:50S ribosomal protein L25/general stress protein Ctc [Anaplasma phagocytophilum]|uniref:Large ribosomal subunit protein bL25 n=3 Tax=Anaplasma phagocytophilum TaxID=948 RepID=RL25_ANAPZ|nr:50S ribosomal protein L25/general stress protein Ctc [Anaplasma phagocytophilum]Q2GII5.1 RecName: Full=Large ribosomal subunit protein bL25; AltName: Full=50S ribosomal protein L25; AltName: Full=General stress protein CTC [Anaplasma phagocytophilum str. HZ]KJZ98856.1 ribosomal protein L25, Ctc-form [Anaplasma phagocytophilum str. CR1007]ABD43960.1 ribosomal 5S rRNA E-loop binding protein Ctc/L25/TL5 [Anaplasma phagocytophilum str. HZ]AGR79121.1 50S ribosomal protein L25 [Anaplasma phagocyto